MSFKVRIFLFFPFSVGLNQGTKTVDVVECKNEEPKLDYTVCFFKSRHWWKLLVLLYPACWVMTGLLSQEEQVIPWARLMEGWGDGWRSGRLDGVISRVSVGGLQKQRKYHHYVGSASSSLHIINCFTPNFSPCISLLEVLSNIRVLTANSGHYNKHFISTTCISVG